MSRYLFDTSAVLAHYRAESGSARVQEILDDSTHDVLLCAATIAEFSRRLVELGASDDDAASVAEEYIGLAAEVIAIDAPVSRLAFRIGRACTTRLPLIDALIAAAAASRRAILVHHDPHMAAIPAELAQTEALA